MRCRTAFRMDATVRKTIVFCGLFVLSCLIPFAIAGCFGGGGTPTPRGSVVGYVTQIDGSSEEMAQVTLLGAGQGVDGADVTLVGTSKVAETSSVGGFSISNVNAGTYDLLVRKTGWPSAKVYGIEVEASRTTEVNLRMARWPEGNVSGRQLDTEPPEVAIDCPSIVSGNVQVQVTPSDESGLLAVMLFVDNGLQSAWGFEPPALGSGETLVWEWETIVGLPGEETGWDNGEHTLTAVAVDADFNIAYRSMKVTVDNSTLPGALPSAPSDLTGIVSTMSYSMLSFPWDPGDIELHSAIIPNGLAAVTRGVRAFRTETGQQVRGTPAGSDAAILSSLYWDYEGADVDVMGFKVYRNGRFETTVVEEEGEGWTDGSPALTPGLRVGYSVSAYNRTGEGPRSATLWRTPLSPLARVVLTGPADGETVTDITPVLSWERAPGAEVYIVFVAATSGGGGYGDVVWAGYALGDDETSVTYGAAENSFEGAPTAPDLVPGEAYQWGVVAASMEPDMPTTEGGSPDLGMEEMPEAVSMSASDVTTFQVAE